MVVNQADQTVAPLRSSRQRRCGQVQLLLGTGQLVAIFVFGSTVEKWDSLMFSVLASTFIGFSFYTLAGTLAINASKLTKHHRWVSACLAFSVLSAIHTVFQICICATVASPVKQPDTIVTTWGIAAAGILSVVELCVSSVQMLECCNMMDKWFERKETAEIFRNSTAAPPTYDEIYMSTSSGTFSESHHSYTTSGGSAGVPPGGSPMLLYAKHLTGYKITGEPPPTYDYFLKYLQPKLNSNQPESSAGRNSDIEAAQSPRTDTGHQSNNDLPTGNPSGNTNTSLESAPVGESNSVSHGS